MAAAKAAATSRVASVARVATATTRIARARVVTATTTAASGLRYGVQDVDFDAGELVVRRGKGQKDRRTMLPRRIVRPLKAHLERVHRQHKADLASDHGYVEIPSALVHKYPNANREWAWQWVFPATRIHRERTTGQAMQDGQRHGDWPSVDRQVRRQGPAGVALPHR